MAHEFGHFFDFANNVNSFKKCDKDNTCEIENGSWTEFSWDNSKSLRKDYKFAQQDGLCFYNCEGNFIAEEKADELYSEMFQTNLISTYAATNPWDDFADSLAYFVMHKFLDMKYIIKTPISTYDVSDFFYSEKFNEKYLFLDNFLRRKNLVYPGQK